MRFHSYPILPQKTLSHPYTGLNSHHYLSKYRLHGRCGISCHNPKQLQSNIVIKQLQMSRKAPYAIDTRQEIARSNVNQSTAKTLWTFSKKKRFPEAKPVCPYVSYAYDLSTISKRKTGFGSSKRKVFTEVNEGASSWNYNPAKPEGYRPETSFGISRDACISGTYLSLSAYKNPGPGKYGEAALAKKRGFSMRPKTAYEKTYFIDNKEQRCVPSPFMYNVNTSRDGVATVSKFRTVTMGATLQSKNQRFKDPAFITPSPSVYRPNKYGINKYCRNGKIGMSERKSFIDDATRSEFTPGPGNYRMPTEFSHYSNFKQSRFSVS